MTTTPATETTQHEDDCVSVEAHAIGLAVADTVTNALKALADPLRLRMLSYVASSATGEACVCDLAALTDVSQPTVSHHLKLLREAGILTSERRGTWVWYRVAPGYRRAVSTLLETFAPATLSTPAPGPLVGPEDADSALDRIATDLATHHPELDRAVVVRTVRESYTALARSAHLSGHLLNLAERFAKQRLTDLSRQPSSPVPQILFLCVANAGRSQLAAALVQYYAGDRVIVRSAGSTPAGQVHPVVQPELADLGVTAGDVFPKPLTDDAVRAADIVITMGCGDVCPVLPGKRYEDWVVGDPALASPAGVAAIRAELDARVRALLTELLPDLDLPLR